MTSSLKSLLAQVFGLCTAFGLRWLFPEWISGIGWALLVQGTAAAMFSLVLGQAYWWFAIHLLFIPAAVAMLALNWPPWLYLLMTMGSILIFWGTVRGDVPLFLSSPQVAHAVADVVMRENAKYFADLGAGLGSVVVPLKQCSSLSIDTWERAPLPWLITTWRCHRYPNVQVFRASFWKTRLTHYDVVFAFLSPAVMVAIGKKIREEMPKGSLFISSCFPIPDWPPEKLIHIADSRQTILYCYRV